MARGSGELCSGRQGLSAERPGGEIGVHAVRGGEVVGDHRVLFLGDHERLELYHAAQSRAAMAQGALVAARWTASRPPGRYSMMDVLGLTERAKRSPHG